MYSRENYRLAKEEIEQKRVAAIALAEQRNAELRASFPEIKEIDDELTGTGLSLFRAACSGADINALRERNQTLMAKRRKLLVKLGYPEDYTDVHYSCTVCRDTGFIDTKMCKCLKELLIMKNIRSSGMGNLIDKQSFDNFDLDWYRTNDEDYKRMAHNFKIARAYARSFAAHSDNLLLIGTTGTGKTHISTAIAAEVIAQGFDVLYDSTQNIVSAFEDDRFRSGFGQRESLSEKYIECDLLIIDDLGTEYTTQYTLSVLYNIINTRNNKGLSTIISTNLTAQELAAKYEGRIYSRIVGSDYTVLFFSGRDHRTRV